MGFCGSCNHNTVPSRTQTPLLQIKRGYRATWNTLEFRVEADTDQWTLRVEDSISRETIYTAHRGGSGAAQSAAADFANFRVSGLSAKELTWQAYW